MNVPLELSARLNGPPRLVGKALVVLCSYRGGVPRKEPWKVNLPLVGRVVNVLTLFGLRQFVATYRDHYANPRNRDYQLAMIQSLLTRASFESFDLLDDVGSGLDGDTVKPEGLGRIFVASAARPESIPAKFYDIIVLVYPDAIGLSWTRTEKHALAAAKESVVVVNGRRRLFTLDAAVHRKLRWRRLLANTRLVQLLAGVLVFPLSVILAATDGIRGRT